MATIDTTPLNPTVATVTPSNNAEKKSRTVLTGPEGEEITIELVVRHDGVAGWYHSQVSRVTKKLNPATGLMVLQSGAPHSCSARLPSVRGYWHEARLDEVFAQSFEAMTSRLAAEDAKVVAVLAAP